jgi:hypothetical protein
LRRLYFHPTRTAYEKLRVESLPERPQDQHVRLFEPPGTLSAAEGCIENARQLLRYADGQRGGSPPVNTLRASVLRSRDDLATALSDAEHALNLANWADLNNPDQLISKRVNVHSRVRELSHLVTTLFEQYWRTSRLFPNPIYGPIPLSNLETRQDEKGRNEDDELVEQANLFVAARVVDFLRQVFPHLKSLIWFITVGVLAMVLATSTYPFPRHDTLLWLTWSAVLSVTIVSVFVFFQINRSRIVSMLSGTDPGRFSWDSAFTWHLLLYVALPVLTLLGAQFPHALTGVFSWAGGLFGGGGK